MRLWKYIAALWTGLDWKGDGRHWQMATFYRDGRGRGKIGEWTLPSSRRARCLRGLCRGSVLMLTKPQHPLHGQTHIAEQAGRLPLPAHASSKLRCCCVDHAGAEASARWRLRD